MATDLRACPSCGSKTPSRFRRCGSCGTALNEAAQASEIRRQATIVTSDLKGSTELGERLDPEALREVLSTYFDEMRAVFESHGGTIQKIIGDAIIAVFGLAIAHDHALRAVEAAAESQRALASLNDRLEATWGVRLTVRTGIASGEVIVGEASAGQHVLTGPTIQIATAMEQNAPPLEVLLAASTYEAVRSSVEVEPMRPVRAKGSDEDLAAYRLVAVADRAEPSEAQPAATPARHRCAVCGEENPEGFAYCGTCGAVLGELGAVQETRKTVTIVFADPRPSSVDGRVVPPEALQDVMSRYFAGMQQALDAHGATVEKFIGDAVMAVFGLPIRHEDDALRAVRAAADMQKALPDLNAAFKRDWAVTLANKIGVNTGEVVAGDASLGQRLVTGDTVNVAARLEQAAGPREILLGELTYRLVKDAVEVEAVEPLALKGKAEPVPAYRLRAVSPAGAGFDRRTDVPMIGREAEIAALRELFGQAVRERACRMATVVGDAGVGKTRLIGEFSSRPPAPAAVIRGRCLPYGKGITFWPLREAARDAAGIGAEESQAIALEKLNGLVADEAVVARLASAIGLSDEPFPVAEISWAARKFLEIMARRQPVVMIVDDIHWAEQTFLELIEGLLGTVEHAPVLLLCTSRHDLLDTHPDWATGPGQLRLVLSPLTDADTLRVISALLGAAGIDADVQARIVSASAGNPLYVEQLLSMLIDHGSLRQLQGRWERVGELSTLDVPPTIQALVAARLDLLAETERAVIEPASVIGQNFAQAAVAELVPDRIRPVVPGELQSLERKQFVAGYAEAREVAFRFHHVTIRDAAYAGLLKRQRAELHERFVNWAEEVDRQMGRGHEFEEIQGYHLEQAYRYLAELGTLDDHARQLGERAARKLASAGRRAVARGDLPAAASLLRRATSTLPKDGVERAMLLPRLAEALLEIGDFAEADSALVDAARIAAAQEDERLLADIALVSLVIQLYTADNATWAESAGIEVERVLPIFERAGDHAGLGLAYRILYILHGSPGRYGQAAEAAQQVISHARAAADRRLETRGITGYAQAALLGPTPVPEALAACEALVQQAAGDRRAEALIRLAMAQLHAMLGRFDVASDLCRAARGQLEDLGRGVVSASTSIDEAQVHILAGDLEAAEAALRRDDAELSAMGEQYVRSTVAGLLARVVWLQGRSDEAEALVEMVRQLTAADDIDPQIAWRSVQAKRLASLGDTHEALELIREALEMSRTADNPRLQASVLTDLAEVQEAAGLDADAEACRVEALELYEQKGDQVSAERLREAMQAERAGA